MSTGKLLKFLLVLVVSFGALVVNIDGGVLAVVGASGSYVAAGLLSLALALMTLERNAALVVLVAALCVLVNMPDEFVADIGISRELLLATLIGVVITPIFARGFGSK